MLLEYAQRPFERMEHRLSNVRGVASIQRMLEHYALASDVGLDFGNVTVGLGKTTGNHRIREIAQTRVRAPMRWVSWSSADLEPVVGHPSHPGPPSEAAGRGLVTTRDLSEARRDDMSPTVAKSP